MSCRAGSALLGLRNSAPTPHLCLWSLPGQKAVQGQPGVAASTKAQKGKWALHLGNSYFTDPPWRQPKSQRDSPPGPRATDAAVQSMSTKKEVNSVKPGDVVRVETDWRQTNKKGNKMTSASSQPHHIALEVKKKSTYIVKYGQLKTLCINYC